MIEETAQTRRNRLLVIDDEPPIAHIIEAIARQIGFEVFAIQDSEQFEAALQSFNPTLILLDINMPKRDGLELIAHLSAKRYPGKVVVMSGSDSRPTGRVASSCGGVRITVG